MGSSFFGKVGQKVEPVAKYLQYVSPGAHFGHEQGKAYTASQKMPASTGPFAGVTPTLADANRSYMPRAPAPIAMPQVQPARAPAPMPFAPPNNTAVWGA